MEYKLVDKIINELLEWKFFRNGFYELSEEDEIQLKSDIQKILDEEI